MLLLLLLLLLLGTFGKLSKIWVVIWGDAFFWPFFCSAYLGILCGGPYSHHAKYDSFMFMHKISTRVVCVNVSLFSFHVFLLLVFRSCKLTVVLVVSKGKVARIAVVRRVPPLPSAPPGSIQCSTSCWSLPKTFQQWYFLLFFRLCPG